MSYDMASVRAVIEGINKNPTKLFKFDKAFPRLGLHERCVLTGNNIIVKHGKDYNQIYAYNRRTVDHAEFEGQEKKA